MAENFKRIAETVDADGTINEGYSRWDCKCGEEVRRYRGEGDVDCHKCGRCYNAGGQLLRSDWRNNPSNYDDEIGDLEGYEMQYAGDE